MKYTSVAVTTAIVAVFLFGTPYAQQDATAAAAIAAGGKVDDAAAHRHRNRDSHSEEWYRSHSGSRSGSHSEEHDRHHDEFPASYAPNDRHGRFPGSYAPHDRHHDEIPATYSPNEYRHDDDRHHGMDGRHGDDKDCDDKKKDGKYGHMAAKHDEHHDDDEKDGKRKVGGLLLLIGAVAALVGLLTFIGCCIRNKCCKKGPVTTPVEKIVVGTEFTQEDIAQAKVAAAACDGIVVTDKMDVDPMEPVAIVVPQEKEQPAPLPAKSLYL